MKRTIIICLMALFAIASYAQTSDVRIYAHRGGMAEGDQNTLSAFNAAYKAGYRGFETDIRLTKDGELVLLHDSSLDALTNGKGNVETSKAKAIKNLRVGRSKVMFLDELVEWIQKKGDIEYFEFELKTDPSLYPEDLMKEMCELVYHKVMSVKPIGSTFVISSSDTRPLIYLKEKFPDANVMFITSEPVNSYTIARVKDLNINRLAARIEDTSRDAVAKAHREGLIVNLWPTDDIQDIVLGISLGADNVCTDIPAAAKKAFKDQLKWVVIDY